MSKFLIAALLSISIPFLTASEPKKTMSYEDIVKIEKPKLVTLSPSGTKVAFVIQRANISENCNFDTLYVWDVKENSQEKVLEQDEIKKISWGGATNSRPPQEILF